MADRGRPRKPDHLKVLHGDRPDRINRSAPAPRDGEIEPPYPLSDEALENWNRLAPDRIRAGVLTVWDVDAFAQFCEALVTARHKIAGARVTPKPGAASGMSEYKAAITVVSTLGARFGWTPSDRAKLTTGGGEPDAKSASRLLS